jgi:NAD+ dependent glucose-6-phosphate dehydrogenase
MAKVRVLLTGASGYLASQLLRPFRDRYDLRLIDVKEPEPRGAPIGDVVLADLSDPDPSRYAHAFAEIDVVVHLAYKRPGDPASDESLAPLAMFEGEFLNLRMAQNVYRCAYERGVRRVVMASSNHAADWYEHALIHSRRREMVSPRDLPLSDNFYGWAKASYELLGFVYACGELGRKLEVVQIRVGAPRDVAGRNYEGELRERHTGSDTSNLSNFKRDLGAYISEPDLCQLFQRAVETPHIEDEHGVPWLVTYGISNNTRAFWSLENARHVLGYRPIDDSEVKYADDIRRLLTGPDARGPGGRVGG